MTISIDNLQAIHQQNLNEVILDGVLKVGDRNYEVKQINNTISVTRSGLEETSTLGRMANAVYDFFARMLTSGESAITTRACQLTNSLQEMNNINQSVDAVLTEVNFANSVLKNGHSRENHIETCIETMGEDSKDQGQIRQLLNDPNYSSALFSSITECPNDGSRFIAHFGDNEIVLSNRAGGTGEYRGVLLREQLENTEYDSLTELISQNYLTENDSMLIYSATGIKNKLKAVTSEFPHLRQQVIDKLQDEMIGNINFGTFCSDAKSLD
ncbi:hypothetical protein [uncultured Shewanella sp.]|uniref:hypothetical protein n=1 Tax=uncultured Shewanella sp. TaxID=173975 RepID=UPI0026134FC0|nr:hypothetical protein [uncultured Shewanella sp.]